MNKDRNLGVSEARYALSILFCVLLGLGFLLLNQLGGTADAPMIELRPAPVPPEAKTDNEAPPQVLTIEGSNGPVIQTSRLQDADSPYPNSSNSPTNSVPTERR